MSALRLFEHAVTDAGDLVVWQQPELEEHSAFGIAAPAPIITEQPTPAAIASRLVIIVPCSAGKVDTDNDGVPAGELYTGAFHRFARSHADRLGARVLILSAWYGLLELDRTVHTYDVKLGDDAGRAKPGIIGKQLEQLDLDPDAVIVSFCPNAYTELLAAAIPDLVTPLAGARGIGEQRGRIANITAEQLTTP